MKKLITIGFSTHRIETLPFAKQLMENHDIIILEEPYNPAFYEFLKDNLSLEEYLKTTDFWFPQFIKESCLILKEFYKKGKIIFQIEPYLEILAKIYQKITKEEKIEDILEDSELREIYLVENKTIGKLLEFYQISLKGNFFEIIKAVKTFSKADAERFRLRDLLRAKAILKILPEKGNIYIEAGTIHLYFKRLLHYYLDKNWKISHKFLLEKFLKPLTGKAWIFPPGELLTLRYILKRKEDTKIENLLAARSLIYIKIIPKEELIPSSKEPYPHIKKELKAIEMVNKLSFEDCAKLYKKLFFVKDPETAEKIVQEYLNSFNN